MKAGTGPRLDGRRSGRRSTQPTGTLAKVPEAPLGPASIVLSHDEIAARAYAYYEARGRVGGDADGDWQRALLELRRRT